MSNFDADIFLDGVVTESFTKRNLLPIGDYVAVIGEIKAQSGMQKKDPTKGWTALNVPLEIDLTQNAAARAVVGQDKVVLYDFVGLDITESGSLDTAPGRNSRLRRYREALDMNTGAFAPRMMQGRMIRVKVKHGVSTVDNEPRDEVDSVAKVG